MVGKTSLPTDQAPSAKLDTSGKPYLRGEDAALPDPAVVGDLHQGVDPGAFSDPCGLDQASGDVRMGPQHDIVIQDNTCAMREHRRWASLPGAHPEAGGSQDNAVSDIRTTSDGDPGMNHHSGPEHTPLPDSTRTMNTRKPSAFAEADHHFVRGPPVVAPRLIQPANEGG